MLQSLPFIDLKTQQARIRVQIDAAIKKVLDHGAYIMGPEVFALEQQLAAFCGAKHVITCANGTDALILALMVKNVRPGDAVFLPSFTFAATAEAVALQGAQIVFIDVLPETFNMDPKSLELGIKTALGAGLKPVGIIPVDLFGQPADYTAIEAIAEQHNLWIIADAAQSLGAAYKARKVGNIGDIATTSFFPAKPLGCYGDGGAIFTNDDDLAATLQSLRIHGQGTDKYNNVLVGLNSRLDSIQAAVLLEKLKIFPDELLARQKVADKYNELLCGHVITPHVINQATSSWAQYTIRLPNNVDRAEISAELKEQGVPTMIYYVNPLHTQKPYRSYLTATGDALPVCEKLAHTVLSLPMHAYLQDATIAFIAEHVCQHVTI